MSNEEELNGFEIQQKCQMQIQNSLQNYVRKMISDFEESKVFIKKFEKKEVNKKEWKSNSSCQLQTSVYEEEVLPTRKVKTLNSIINEKV